MGCFSKWTNPATRCLRTCCITLGKTERPVRLGRSGPWRSDPQRKINCEVNERCRCGVKKPEGEGKKMNEK